MKRLVVSAVLLLTTASCDTAGFSEAYMSLDSAGRREREYFFTDTENIYCFGKLASGVDDLTVSGALRARQIYDPRSGTATDVDFYLGMEDQAPGAGEDISVSFLLERESEEPYPAGKFVCELALDGEVVESLPFEIRIPACPEAPIFSGAVCEGFVLQGARCAGALAGQCTCQEDGVWSCP